MHKILLDI